MSVSARTRPRRVLAAAASRLGRPAAPGIRAARGPVPAGTPHHLRQLPSAVLGGGEVIHVARTFRARLRGLLGTDVLPSGHALLLTRTRSIHMLGMRLTIDLVWLDAEGRPVRVDHAVAPGSHHRCRAARSVLETPSGEGDRFAALVRAGGVAMITGH
ncbi:MAG: DUF192 domain-containing protein [Solirubrobacteraceae bacterium]